MTLFSRSYDPQRCICCALGAIAILVILCLLMPGHLLPRAVHVDLHIEKIEPKQLPTESGLMPGLLVTVRATNRSGYTVWYTGLREVPDRVILLYVDGKWKLESMFSTSPGNKVGHKINKVNIKDSEIFYFGIIPEEKTDKIEAIKVMLQFGSSYCFGFKDKKITVEAEKKMTEPN